MAAQVEKKPRGRPKKNKDPLGAEEVDAEEMPQAVVATFAGDAEAEKVELQQKLDVTTEQLAQSHAKQVQMEAQIRELEAQMASYIVDKANETMKEAAMYQQLWQSGQQQHEIDKDSASHIMSGLANEAFSEHQTLAKQLQEAKWIITQTSICGNKRDHVLNAQQKKLAQRDKVYITKVTDSLDINYRFDDCHFNKFGTEKIAIEISKIINKLNNKK